MIKPSFDDSVVGFFCRDHECTCTDCAVKYHSFNSLIERASIVKSSDKHASALRCVECGANIPVVIDETLSDSFDTCDTSLCFNGDDDQQYMAALNFLKEL